MPRMNTGEARREFADTLNRVAFGGERIILSRRGRDVAALIPIEQLRLLDRLLEEYQDRLDVEAAREALKESDERISYDRVRAISGCRTDWPTGSS